MNKKLIHIKKKMEGMRMPRSGCEQENAGKQEGASGGDVLHIG